jgi:hypothetical protein
MLLSKSGNLPAQDLQHLPTYHTHPPSYFEVVQQMKSCTTSVTRLASVMRAIDVKFIREVKKREKGGTYIFQTTEECGFIMN